MAIIKLDVQDAQIRMGDAVSRIKIERVINFDCEPHQSGTLLEKSDKVVGAAAIDATGI